MKKKENVNIKWKPVPQAGVLNTSTNYVGCQEKSSGVAGSDVQSNRGGHPNLEVSVTTLRQNDKQEERESEREIFTRFVNQQLFTNQRQVQFQTVRFEPEGIDSCYR